MTSTFNAPKPLLPQVSKVILLIAALSACSKMKDKDLAAQFSGLNSCEGPIEPWIYLQQKASCSSNPLESKKLLHGFVPCNQVRAIRHANQAVDTNKDIFNWLLSAPTFDQTMADNFFKNRKGKFAWQVNNPILARPMAMEIKRVLDEAKELIFFDEFLLGGTWGLDVSGALLDAAERGVKVIVLKDIDNSVGVAHEVQPIWANLIDYSKRNENLIALAAGSSEHPSAFPFGINNIVEPLDKILNLPVSLSGKSDHSKTIIVDPFGANPKMLVGSKNVDDTAAAMFFDETLAVTGPAATAAFLLYQPDLILGVQRTNEEYGSLPPKPWFEAIQGRIAEIRAGKERIAIPVAGNAPIRLLENNGDDSVRNVESSLLALLENANESIEMYFFLAYNGAISKALVRAMDRGVKVRVLLDSLPMKIDFNAILAFFMGEIGNRDAWDLPLRWRRQLRGNYVRNPEKELFQQQHVKTVIVDNRFVLIGSSNFDFATLAGAFRELSAIVDDRELARQSRGDFDAVFNSNELSAPFVEFRGREVDLTRKAKVKSIMDTMRAESVRRKLLDPETMNQRCF